MQQPTVAHCPRRIHWSLVLLSAVVSTACWGSKTTDDGAAGGAGSTEPATAVISIDIDDKAQTLEGFGAATAWYGGWYTNHPNRRQLATILFKDLGLDILRLRNQYRTPDTAPDPDGLAIYQDATASLGYAPRVLLSSWTPPADLKANGVVDCKNSDATCTLKKNDDGSYPYVEFGEYWADSLEAYRVAGLDPYYISIQNEPDFIPSGDWGWEACRFDPTESDSYPGYDRAFAAVVASLSARNLEARLLGPETAQITSTKVERYLANVDPRQLYGIAHHLYDGSKWENPISYGTAMAGIAKAFPELPRFQTEFSATTNGAAANQSGFEIAWLIHEALTVEGAAAYLHWDLFWDGSGLVDLENPWSTAEWTTAEGFKPEPPYYALRHYARYTNPGDQVVSAESSLATVLAVAFASADDRRLTLVLLNRMSEQTPVTLDLGAFAPKQSLRVESVIDPLAEEDEDGSKFWQSRPALDGATSQFELAPRSITTIVATLDDELPE